LYQITNYPSFIGFQVSVNLLSAQCNNLTWCEFHQLSSCHEWELIQHEINLSSTKGVAQCTLNHLDGPNHCHSLQQCQEAFYLLNDQAVFLGNIAIWGSSL